MPREHEYKYLADNARKRGGEEQNAQIRGQWEIWLPLTCSLPISRRRLMTPAHITIRWIVANRSVGPFVNRVALKSHLDLSLNLRPDLRGLNLLRVTRKVCGRHKVRRPLFIQD